MSRVRWSDLPVEDDGLLSDSSGKILFVWVAEAELCLTAFLKEHGGSVPTTALAALYDANPCLAKSLGNLQEYCKTCPRLKFSPRAGRNVATVSLVGWQPERKTYVEQVWPGHALGGFRASCAASPFAAFEPMSSGKPAALAAPQHQAGTGNLPNEGAESEQEFYRPRWMSRVTLLQQLRRRSCGCLPFGFSPRRRSERRRRQAKWLHGFLEAFWPELAPESGGMMAAIRRWPTNDAQQKTQQVATEDAISVSGPACSSHTPADSFRTLSVSIHFDLQPTPMQGDLGASEDGDEDDIPFCSDAPSSDDARSHSGSSDGYVGVAGDMCVSAVVANGPAADYQAGCLLRAEGAVSAAASALRPMPLAGRPAVDPGMPGRSLPPGLHCHAGGTSMGIGLSLEGFAQMGESSDATPLANDVRAAWAPRQQLLLRLGVCCIFPCTFAVAWAVLHTFVSMSGLSHYIYKSSVLCELWVGVAGDLSYHIAWVVGRRLSSFLQRPAHLPACALITGICVFAVALACVEAEFALALGFAPVPGGVVRWFGLGSRCRSAVKGPASSRAQGKRTLQPTAANMLPSKRRACTRRGDPTPPVAEMSSSSSDAPQRCCGRGGKGCPRNFLSKASNDGMCYLCQPPPCPGVGGSPCPRGNRSRNAALLPCKSCIKAAAGGALRAAPARGELLTGHHRRPVRALGSLAQSLRRRVSGASTCTVVRGRDSASSAPASNALATISRRRLRGKQPARHMAESLSMPAVCFASGRRYRCCDVEWCDERARETVPSEGSFCKAHARWFGIQDRSTGLGYRSGYFAGRSKPEDFRSSRVLLHLMGQNPVMEGRCQFCNALYFTCEAARSGFNLCCRQGKLKHVPTLPPAPQPLARLLSAGGRQSDEFRQNIRRYNAALAFASFNDAGGAVVDGGAPQAAQARGPPVYIMHGQAYHATSTLYPSSGREPRYGQLYIYDPQEAATRRATAFEGLDRQVLFELHRMLVKPVLGDGVGLRPRNPYPADYRHLHERVCEEEARALARGQEPRQQVLKMCCAKVPDPRRYNKPSSREVAVVFVGSGPVSDHFVNIYPRRTITNGHGGVAGDVQRLSYLAEHTDPLTYPLVYVAGTLGWSTNLEYCADHLPRGAKQLRITLAEFYAYRLVTRVLPSSRVVELPHSAGRLFQQWIVDAYAKLESTRLDWVLRNQSKFRVETLQGLTDHVAGLDYSMAPLGPKAIGPQGDAEPAIVRALRLGAQHCVSESAVVPACSGDQLALKVGAGEPAPRPLQTVSNAKVGKRILLPATFGGSPRDLHQCYLDAMALVSKFGRPDFFITMTANPNWEEVRKNLRRGETAADRPDLVSRVFKAKLRELIHDLTVKGVFGKAIAYTYVVEFQKRGLPHAHILLIVKASDKPHTPADVDRLVSAEVPDKSLDPHLHHLVETFMVHGPCGALDPTCPCMDELGKCSKCFPKAPREETEVNVGGYPAYRRRLRFPPVGEPAAPKERWVTRSIGRGEQDSTWIVPFSAFLLTKFECHLNVEVCTSIRAVKYLYKYTYKGPDRACIEVGFDEVTAFQDARYVGAPEASWRLFEFALHAKSHQVLRLPVHLPKEQNVVFQQGQEHEALARAQRRKTPLEGWFELNRCLPPGHATRQVRYADMPSHFVWDVSSCRWQPRRRGPRWGQALGRMFNVKPTAGELYYLRLLLLHVPGATGWGDFMQRAPREQGGPLPKTYREACRGFGLLHDDAEAFQMLRDAVEIVCISHRKMHELFAESLVWCDVADPALFWEKYQKLLQEQRDIRCDSTFAGLSNRSLAVESYRIMDEVLQGYNFHPSTFGIEAPSPEAIDPRRGFREYAAELRDAAGMVQERARCDAMQLYPEQVAAFDAIAAAVAGTPCKEATHGNVFYIDGPGGSGKTFLYTKLLRHVRSLGKIALAVSMSGIAALLLEGGRTAHSRFRLPVPLPLDGVVCNVKPRSVLADLLRDAAIIVWDEAPTAPKAAVQAVDEMLRDLMNCSHLPFGGKVVVLGGDWRQIPPILRRVDEKAIKSFTLRSLPWWRSCHITHFALTRNMRAGGDAEYASFLERLGDGTQPNSYVDLNGDPLHQRCIRLPDALVAPYSWGPMDLMRWVYGDYSSVEPASWSDYYESRMVVTPLNSSAAELNNMMLDGLQTPGDHVAFSHDYAVVDASEPDHYTPEFLNTLEPNGMPPHELRVRPGALMILLRNYAPQKGLCNGTRVVVRGQWRRLLQVQVVTGPAKGRLELLPRIVCDSTGDAELPFTLRRLQFPVRPAWVISINKGQGQTVGGMFGIYLPTPVFAHGQLYVAHSRATESANVRVLAESYEDQQRKLLLGPGDSAALFTLNLVDRTLLSDDDGGCPAPMGPPTVAHCPGVGSVASDASGGGAAGEAHRLATVTPDPLSMPADSHSALLWSDGDAACHPFLADEWVRTEAGMPCTCSGSAATVSLLEERGPDDLEYESEAEAEDGTKS
jgi:hypothetical protein